MLTTDDFGARGYGDLDLNITHPTAQGVWVTGATNLSLAGSAAALDQDVTRVAWENAANKLSGVADGSATWNVAGIPLVAGKTNVIVVTGTTTSWAPACGGNTPSSETLMVVCSPIPATLTLEGTTGLLSWTCGGPRPRIQPAADLFAADWTEVLSDAMPPVILPVTGSCGSYRVVGQQSARSGSGSRAAQLLSGSLPSTRRFWQAGSPLTCLR